MLVGRADARDDSERAALVAALKAARTAHNAACQAAAGDDSIAQTEAQLRAVQQRHAAVQIETVDGSHSACSDSLGSNSMLVEWCQNVS